MVSLRRLFWPMIIVQLTSKARKVTVKGPKGQITKSFKHMAVEMKQMKQDSKKRKGNYLNIKMWFGGKKQACSVATLKSIIRNMITGVTQVSSFFQIFSFFIFYPCNLIIIINMCIGLQIQDETSSRSLPH